MYKTLTITITMTYVSMSYAQHVSLYLIIIQITNEIWEYDASVLPLVTNRHRKFQQRLLCSFPKYVTSYGKSLVFTFLILYKNPIDAISLEYNKNSLVFNTTLSQEWSKNSILGPQYAFEMSMFMCPAVHKLTRN